jgi:ABC-2 type transport system permease protein
MNSAEARLTVHHSNTLTLVKNEPWLCALVFFAPLVLSFLLWSIFSARFATALPVAIVDLDNTALSRAVIRTYNASPTLTTRHITNNPEVAEKALRASHVYSVIIIPNEFEKHTLLGHMPIVDVRYNSQFVLIGKLIKSAILTAHGTFNARVEVIKNMSSTQGNIALAANQAMPITQEMTSLYNGKNDYAQFLVSSSVPAMWQIIIMASTVLLLSKVMPHLPKKQRLSACLAQVFNHLFYLAFIFLSQACILLLCAIFFAKWPFNGSFIVWLCACLSFIFASQGLAALIYCLLSDATRAMSFVAAIAAPAFAFMGITFPVVNMPLLAQLWRNLLPAAHYIELQNQQMNYGHLLLSTLHNLLALILISSTGLFAIWLWHRKHNKECLN